jgi:hypothetical protein
MIRLLQNQSQVQKKASTPKIDPKVQEIIDFFPGAEVETLDN